MGHEAISRSTAVTLAALLLIAGSDRIAMAEPRNAMAHPRTSYQLAFYKRHNPTYRVAGALHFAHSKLHDVLLLTPFQRHALEDAKIYDECLAFLNDPPRIEPTQELYAPYTARATWRLFRVIDWAHGLHEMTYDIMADKDVPWNEKGEALHRAFEHYTSGDPEVVLSRAPLDVTMRRAGVMMKPYFSLTRNYYPKVNNFFYAAHWWHPATYEAMIVSGNDEEQEMMLAKLDQMFRSKVITDPPLRMILSREGMPRYSRLSPQTANVFDNLHMLHGITYDIFVYDGWTIEEKRAELYRVLDAMRSHPGDEKLARKFRTPRPELNPLLYNDQITSADGAMTRMMMEMLREMMPMMMRGHGPMREAVHQRLVTQLRLKLTPGIQADELAGSFVDAMIEIMPAMQRSSVSTQPGVIDSVMVQTMLDGWRQNYGSLPDADPQSMDTEPSAVAILQAPTN